MAVIVKGVTSSGGGAKIATILNDDGTQSLIIADKDTVIDLTPLDSEINEQTDLIAQIQAELDAKAEGGGGSPSVSGEISITENGIHDVAQYATANVNIPIPSSDPVLLWTNASPTSNFGGGDVSVSGAGFDYYLIECKHQSTADGYGWALVKIGEWGSVIASSGTDRYGKPTYRLVTASSESVITFASGYQAGSGGPSYCIPTRIWGVKFTL